MSILQPEPRLTDVSVLRELSKFGANPGQTYFFSWPPTLLFFKMLYTFKVFLTFYTCESVNETRKRGQNSGWRGIIFMVEWCLFFIVSQTKFDLRTPLEIKWRLLHACVCTLGIFLHAWRFDSRHYKGTVPVLGKEQWIFSLFNQSSFHLSLHSVDCWPLKGLY